MPHQNQVPFYPDYALRPDFYTTIDTTEAYLFQEQVYFIDGGDFCIDPSGRLYGGSETLPLIDLHQISYTFPHPNQPKPDSAFLWLHRNDEENVDKIKSFLNKDRSEQWAKSVVGYLLKSIREKINLDRIKNEILKYFIGNEKDVQTYYEGLAVDLDNGNIENIKNTLAKIYRRKRQALLKDIQTSLHEFQEKQNKDVLEEHARRQVFQQLQDVFNNEQTHWQALYVHDNDVNIIVFDKCTSFPRLIDDHGTRFGLADINLKSIFLTMASGHFDIKKYHDNLPMLRNVKSANYSNDANTFNFNLTVEDPDWISIYSPFDVRTHDFNLAEVAGEEFSDYCHSDIDQKTNKLSRLPLTDQQHEELKKFNENLENRLNYFYDLANKACNNTLNADERTAWLEVENNSSLDQYTTRQTYLTVRLRSELSPRPGDQVKIESDEFSQAQLTVEKVEKSRLEVNLLLKGNNSTPKSCALRSYLYHIKTSLYRKSQIYTDNMFSIELFGRINSFMLLDQGLTKYLTKELEPYRQHVNQYIVNFINTNAIKNIPESESIQTPYFYAGDVKQNNESNTFLIQNTSFPFVQSTQLENGHRFNNKYPSFGFWNDVSNSSSRNQTRTLFSLSPDPTFTILIQLMFLAGTIYFVRKYIASLSAKNQETHSNNDDENTFSSFQI